MSSRSVSKLALDGLEHWLQSEIVAPHEHEKRTPRSRRTTPARDVILPSPSLAPAERVAIYAESYFLRLRECLAVDYPVVLAIVGEAAFTRLARNYLVKFPSRHYSLNVLGMKLPRYLQGRVSVPRRALVCNIAVLEATMARVFDAAPSPVIGKRDLEQVPADQWQNVRLAPITAFALVASNHRASAMVTAIKQEQARPNRARHKTWVAVYRRHYQVIRMDLTEPMFAMLTALSAGKTIGRALKTLARRFPLEMDELAPRVFAWFRDWVQEGLFQSIRW